MELLPPKASPFQLYRQAKRLLRETSRAKEADWYREAGDLNLQWHLWIGGHSGVSAIHNRAKGQWWAGPELPPVAFESNEQGLVTGLDKASRAALHGLVDQLFRSRDFGGRTRSLGVVIHLADGLRVRDLAPEFADDDDFESLNELLVTAPAIAIGDDTVENQGSRWRLLPFLGAPEGAKRSLAVQVSAKLAPIVDELRRYGEARNLPVIVNLRSAPLESMAGLAYLFPEIQAAEAGSTLCLIQYETLTLLFAVGNRGELLLVRPIVHRGSNHLSPAETHEVLTQTAALLDIRDPRLVLLSTTGLSEQQLEFLLEIYREDHPRTRYHCLDARHSPFTEGIPGRRFELAVSARNTAPLADEAPFQRQLREHWALQDFYGPSRSEAALIPTRGDLRLLQIGGLVQKVVLVGLLGFCGWVGYDFIQKMRSDAWSLEPGSPMMMDVQLMTLQKERREWQHWDQLLQKRSEGWLAMEALLEIFPPDGGVILKNADYRVDTVDSGESGAASDADSIGVKRSWTLSGFANPEVATDLPNLGSRTRAAELLNAIAERNHAPYLSVSEPTRNVEVTLQQKQAPMPSSVEFPAKVARHFRTSFDLTITQSLDSKDEYAINTKPLKGQ